MSMRDTIIGVVLAVAFVAAMFGLAQLHPHVAGPPYVEAAADVKQGYVGVKQIGPWQLACGAPPPGQAGGHAAIPFSLNPNPKTSAAAEADAKSPLARCRTTLIYRRKDNPQAVIMAVSFRYTKDHTKLALIIRFPAAFAQKGDNLIIAVAQKEGIRLPVVQCEAQNGCLGAGLLQADGQNLILTAKQGVLIFPTKPNAKPLRTLVPFVGLKESLEAIKRAES